MTALSRRNALRLAVAIAAGSAAPARAQKASCEADGLTPTQQAQRSSLHYTDPAPNKAATCSACAFFSEPAGGCGKCQILGSAVSAGAHCDSWSKRS